MTHSHDTILLCENAAEFRVAFETGNTQETWSQLPQSRQLAQNVLYRHRMVIQTTLGWRAIDMFLFFMVPCEAVGKTSPNIACACLCTDSCRCQSGMLLPSRQDRQEANRYLRYILDTWSACARIWFVTWICWKGLKFRISALYLFRHPKDSERFMRSRNQCKKWFTWLLYRNSQDLGLPCEVSAFQVWQFQGSDAKVLAENFRGPQSSLSKGPPVRVIHSSRDGPMGNATQAPQKRPKLGRCHLASSARAQRGLIKAFSTLHPD